MRDRVAVDEKRGLSNQRHSAALPGQSAAAQSSQTDAITKWLDPARVTNLLTGEPAQRRQRSHAAAAPYAHR